MALFSKPPIKKPAAAKAKTASVHPAAPTARELALKAGGASAKPKIEPVRADESITGASLTEWSAQPLAIEVAQANPGLCAVLENAALLYASGQAAAARSLLEQGVATDHDTKQSPLAWLALFDLLQRAGDRAAFDQLALQYSVQFERSAPAWEGKAAPQTSARAIAGGYVAISGQLTADSATQLEGLRRAIDKKVPRARIDFAQLGGFDDAGAKLLASALLAARRARLELAIERPQRLKAALDAAIKGGRDAGEGAWLLSLELLQWSHDQATFDERAIEYAIAFEMSPPSWEPPPLALAPDEPVDEAPATAGGAADAVVLSGVLTGHAGGQASHVVDFAHGRHVIPIDMSAVERIDFVCAGALLNAVNRVEGQRKSVQIVGATPIIRALLLLIGLSPRHFVKKAA
jgi:anti-anti-sigma regulatory factor